MAQILLYGNEYSDVIKASGNNPIQAVREPSLASWSRNFGDIPHVLSPIFHEETILLRLVSEADVLIEFGIDVQNVVADFVFLPAKQVEYFGVLPGHSLVAISPGDLV